MGVQAAIGGWHGCGFGHYSVSSSMASRDSGRPWTLRDSMLQNSIRLASEHEDSYILLVSDDPHSDCLM